MSGLGVGPWALWLAPSLLLSGCATPRPPTPSAAAPGRWSGLIALRVAQDAARSFSARFELEGSAREGLLELRTPLGTTAARVDWSPAGARLRTPGQPTRQAASVDALLEAATGTALPVAALFDWLAGVPTPVAGWQPDLSQRAAGRLSARRAHPAAEVRLVLEAP